MGTLAGDIDADRLLSDLSDFSKIGGRTDGGLDRVAWSAADLEARSWLSRRIEDIGWVPRTDAAMNLFGSASATRRPRLLIGSHSDSVPAGGRFDGSYGVIAALEAVRSLAEARDPAAECVELVSFADEEGVRFPCGYFGSKALVGMLDVLDGPAQEILGDAGVDLNRIGSASEHLNDVAGYLELHVEQGPILDHDGLQVGVATGIFGFDRYVIDITGRSDHGGTTPFDLRADPVRAAADFIAGLEELVAAEDGSGRATVGNVSTGGGAINIVASHVRFTLEMRQPSPAALERTVKAARVSLDTACESNHCSATLSRHDQVSETKDGMALAVEDAYAAPVGFDLRLVDCCDRACLESGARYRRLSAGTRHDAAIIAAHRPTAMLLVPSRHGITHSPEEETSDEDLIMGARTLLHAARLAVVSLGLT